MKNIAQHAIKRGMSVLVLNESLNGSNDEVNEKALVAGLRGDFDLVVLGEIRSSSDLARSAASAASIGMTVLATMYSTSIAEGISSVIQKAGNVRSAISGMRIQTLLPALCRQCEGDGCLHCASRGRDGLLLVSEEAYFSGASSVLAAETGDVSWPTMKSKALGLLSAGLISESVFNGRFR